ncbi:MAG TPA: cytochrome P450 [Steroidobacteraceae bacterium]|nr:cytochrome P450 [Steroidobacteraceae bacterium]
MSEGAAVPAGARQRAESFDPARLDEDFYADPYPAYRALREFSPVHRCPDGTWFLTRYRDLEQIYRDRTHFSSDKQAAFAPKFGVGSPLYEHHTTSLVFRDPPYHTRVRRQIVGALTPHVLKAMEPGVAALVNSLHDEMQERGEFDLIEHFAAAIPIEVIGNLLQVPRADRAALRGWSLAILGALEPVVSADQRAAGDRAVSEFCACLRELIAARRRHPLGDDDLLTRLAGDTQLSEAELLHNCIFLLNAGHETTTNLIGNALHLLLGAPQALGRLRAEPHLIDSTVEECLRLESPNQLGNRLVVEPVRVGDTELAPGEYLTLCIGAANRDPQEFPDPDRFDPTRKPNRHLAFAAGAHACAGMSVARLEAQIAILRTVQRFPGLHLTGGAVRGGRARFRGFRSLPAACR